MISSWLIGFLRTLMIALLRSQHSFFGRFDNESKPHEHRTLLYRAIVHRSKRRSDHLQYGVLDTLDILLRLEKVR